MKTTQEQLDSLKAHYSNVAPPEGNHWATYALKMEDLTLEKLAGCRERWAGNWDNGWKKYAPLNLLATMSPDTREAATEDLFGRPKVTWFQDKPYSYSSIEYAYMADLVRQHAPEKHTSDEASIFMEIGGGYGGLRRAIDRLYHPHAIIYDIFDLGPMCVLQGVYRVEADVGEWYTSYGWNFFGQGVTDVVLASRSLFELPLDVANWYLERVNKVLFPGGIFFSIARNKASNPDEWNMGNLELIFEEPWVLNPRLKVRIYRKPTNPQR
jgi:hypothetical protein